MQLLSYVCLVPAHESDEAPGRGSQSGIMKSPDGAVLGLPHVVWGVKGHSKSVWYGGSVLFYLFFTSNYKWDIIPGRKTTTVSEKWC